MGKLGKVRDRKALGCAVAWLSGALLAPAALAQPEADEASPPSPLAQELPVTALSTSSPELAIAATPKLSVDAPAHDQTAAETSPSEAEPARSWTDFVTLSGYAEAYYSYNFARPENNITNNRWLDERHNSVTLQTVALDVSAEKGPVSAKVTLMFGPTADRWYFEGARIPDSENHASLSPGAYSNETWKHIQTAYAGYRAPLGNGLLITGGLMPTQVGYESAAVKDNWNWSRSNIFNFLPFFHLGLRAAYPLTESLTVSASVYNGWNQATDLNKGKTVSLQTSWLRDGWFFNLLYLGGPERPRGDAAGQPWRNLFDAVMQYDVLPTLSLAADVLGGFERSDLGTDLWAGGALYARLKATDWLYFAARGDGIYERVATRNGTSEPIFFGGGDHVLSGTLTAELRPFEGISFRLEGRHDDSDPKVPLYYKRGFDTVGGAGTQRTSRAQNTFTVGLTGWF